MRKALVLVLIVIMSALMLVGCGPDNKKVASFYTEMATYVRGEEFAQTVYDAIKNGTPEAQQTALDAKMDEIAKALGFAGKDAVKGTEGNPEIKAAMDDLENAMKEVTEKVQQKIEAENAAMQPPADSTGAVVAPPAQ